MDERPRDAFDRLIGAIDGLPDVRKAKPSTVRTVMPILGDAQTYIVQTYRDRDEGFYAFIETVNASGSIRVVLPPKAMAALYRQRDAIVKASRRSSGRDRWRALSDDDRAARVAKLHETRRAKRAAKESA